MYLCAIYTYVNFKLSISYFRFVLKMKNENTSLDKICLMNAKQKVFEEY